MDHALAVLLLLCQPSDAYEMAPHVAFQARHHGVPAIILAAVARNESGCRAGLVSSKGAVGRWQILPGGSAASVLRGIDVQRIASDEVNAYLAARHLRRWYRKCGSWEKALGVYNGAAKRCSDPTTGYAKDVLSWVEQARKGRRS